MAQYYKVLSQNDKSAVDELRKYYPNLTNENQTVQYVITPEEQPQQTFQGQQILVTSGEQLMVVDGQPGTIAVDQQQITYQQQQYVVQEASIDPQQTRPVYYTQEEIRETVNHPEVINKEPIVLNHHLQQSPLRGQVVTQKTTVVQTSLEHQAIGVQQVRQQLQPQLVYRQLQVVTHSPRVPHLQQPRPIQQVQPQKNSSIKLKVAPGAVLITKSPQINRAIPGLHYTRPSVQVEEETVEEDNQTAIALEDGTIVTLAHYKQILSDQGLTDSSDSPQKQPAQKPRCSKPTVAQPKMQPSPTDKSAVRPVKAPHQNPPLLKNDAFLQRQQQQQQIRLQQLQQQQQRRQLASQGQYQARLSQQQVRMAQPVQQLHQQPQYVIQPQAVQQQLQQPQPQLQQRQCPLPAYVLSSQLQEIIANTPISEEYSNSIRMLVLLPNGEQRLITFTLPKEACTIHEILEQVNVPFKPDTNISVTEYGNCGLNYVVTVGCPELLQQSGEESRESAVTSSPQQEQQNQPQQEQQQQQQESSEPEPEQVKEQPKFIPGKLAVCMHCGYLSEDFNKCLRCKRKLPEDAKSVPVNSTNNKALEVLASNVTANEKKLPQQKVCSPMMKSTNGTSVTLKKKVKPKVVEAEPVILTLSSDDEEEQGKKASATEQLIQKLAESSVTLSAIRKEPSISDIQQDNKGEEVKSRENIPDIIMEVECRTIRIGSYRFVPPETLKIRTSGLIMKVPHPKNPKEIKTIIIEKASLVKVLVSFNKLMQVIFYYVKPSTGQKIRDILGMTEGTEPYFDPLSTQEACRRITILPEVLFDNVKPFFRQIYGKPYNIIDELNAKEANDILMMTCPKEVTKFITSMAFTDIKQLFIYPPGRGGLPINTEDYLCLAQDQFLNDVIIDFYLTYLVLNMPKEQQEKVHVFSTFFYKRLTTKPLKASRSLPSETDVALTPAQKRHARVKNWTKNVNLFDKDFIIIPINEHCHWFLAIVCFPSLDGTFTLEGQPVKVEPKQKKKKAAVATIGNVTITTVKTEKEEKSVSCEDTEMSDKDEAEGDDSELDEEEPEEQISTATPEDKQQKQPIKQPCILIFDSLTGSSRSRVVATLRDYLTCEYKAKMGTEKVFTKDVIKGACPKVPQQTNFTDCGLYLLQYAEQFFKNPIKDYRIPIGELKTWFDESTVTRKREDIAMLIRKLMHDYCLDTSVLPDILLPTKNGKPVESTAIEDCEEFAEDEDDELQTQMEKTEETSELNYAESPVKLSQETTASGEVTVEPSVTNALCPDLSEIRKENNRDTMSYLKAKRINRHKNVDVSDAKKFKSSV